MHLYFIRHGQSSNNDLFQKTGGRTGRKSDPELTDLGYRQAENLGQYVFDHKKDFGLTHIYTSLMARAVQTAIPLADKLNLPIQGYIDLHESGGVYLEDELTGSLIGQPGKNRQEIQALYPNLIPPPELDGNGWWNRPFEAPEDRPVRARRVAEWIKTVHGDSHDRIAILSHYGFFNHLIWSILGLERPQGSWFVMNNTGICHFDLTNEGVNTIYLNRIDHLQPEQITE
jgi:2,3-bisphosphoglycerate-dependent phosphoglycerate mutase